MVYHTETEMPDDWNDHAAWDEYYRAQLTKSNQTAWDDGIGSIRLDQLPQLVEDLKRQSWRSVWVPGCGLSPLAYLLAHLGLEVTATDVSPTVVEFQRNASTNFGHLTTKLGEQGDVGSLTVELHDFRTQFRQDAFDLVINVKAIQAFSATDMVAIAKVHAEALRPGRYAYFDTINVQGERRDQIDQSLEDGGFVVPLLGLNRWYRRALAETGIPYVFILGQPIIPRTGEYADGGPMWDADMARLQKIATEYARRLPSEQETDQLRIGADARVAYVIYSTG